MLFCEKNILLFTLIQKYSQIADAARSGNLQDRLGGSGQDTSAVLRSQLQVEAAESSEPEARS